MTLTGFQIDLPSAKMSHFGLRTDWTHPNSLSPKAGDKIEFKRTSGVYKHVGIADGRGGIYHFSGETRMGSEVEMKSQATWRHDRITDIAQGDPMRINNSLDSTISPFDEDEIVRRCRSSLGFFQNTYNVRSNNCEHKANEMGYGVATSQQAETAQTAGLATGGILVSFFMIAGFIVSLASGSQRREGPQRR